MFAIPIQFIKGMIITWYGSLASIPSGWVLCDGDNGTPNLHQKFILGAGFITAPGTTGGAATHTHLFNAGTHYHDVSTAFTVDPGTVNDTWDTDADNDSVNPATVAGTTQSGSNYPPHHALAYIMRIR